MARGIRMTAHSITGNLGRSRQRSRPVPLPRDYAWLSARDIWLVVAGVGVVIAAMWVRHGGLTQDPVTIIGQVTALGGTYAALVGVLFASRAPWLDQVIGPDGLRAAHRVLGFLSVWAIGAHAAFSTVAFAGGSLEDAIPTLVTLTQTVPGMLGAIVGLGLFILVGVSSVRAARARISYETWHGLHLYAYLAVAFGFLHQLTIGTDFATDPLAAAFWIALYAAAFLPLLVHRVGWPLYVMLRHRPRVLGVTREGYGIFSLYVSGRNLDRLAVRSGQFFIIRALTVKDWMHGHPFSISAAPNGDHLRFTIKAFGEGTHALATLAPGTPLLLEGPYGAIHGARRRRRRVLLIAGGIGVSPMRAMAESFAYGPGELDIVYRSRSRREAALLDELEALAVHRGIRLHLVAGKRGDPGVGADPLSPESLRRMVPDATDRDVYLCGPHGLMERARRALLALGADPARIHLELFST
jgi:predicted ferric reductase